MRIRCIRLATVLFVAVNILIVYYSWKLIIFENIANSTTWFHLQQETSARLIVSPQRPNKNPQKQITIVFREFYDFENDLRETMDSVTKLFPEIKVLVISEDKIYPPPFETDLMGNISTVDNQIQFINLNFDYMKPMELAWVSNPLDLIQTQFVLFLPDGVRINKKSFLPRLLKFAVKIEATNILKRPPMEKLEKWIVVIPVNTSRSFGNSLNNCINLELDFPDWTLTYNSVSPSTNFSCDMLTQKHGILMKSDDLNTMSFPMAVPFPEYFYIQSKLMNFKKYLYNVSLPSGPKKLFESPHSKKLKNERINDQLRKMYKSLKIKRVIKNQYKSNSGKNKKLQSKLPIENNQVIVKIQDEKKNSKLKNYSLQTVQQMYGCEISTRSCLGRVFDEKPFYLYINRNLPPCCRENLITVFRLVIEELENVGIRYWLDNNSLKSAVELKGILSPKEYEIDIAFNSFDANRSLALKKSHYRPYNSNNGLVWLKATDGNYFKVFYSNINRIGVNLLPFTVQNSNVYAKGFTGRKAKKFSVDFLHPMSSVLFLNRTVFCPNNVREFLEINSNN